MPKLIVNPDTASAWEIPLVAGANLLGRGAACDFPIEHETVSELHCQITVNGTGASIQDLGSAGGTVVNGEPVANVRLQPGQSIQLGEVLLRFENELAEPIPNSAASPNALPNPIFCKSHPKAVARHFCPQCGNHFCDLCVSRHSKRGRIAKFCMTCNVECQPVETQTVPAIPETPFARQLLSAFTFPLKGDGIVLIVGGTVFLLVTGFLARYAAILGFLLAILVSGYLISYYQNILLSSAIGEDKLPDWPDFTNFGELLSPVFQFIGTMLISFGPAIMVQIFAPQGTAWSSWAFVGLMVVGCLYFPMGFTAVTMADSLSALNPLVIIPSILKIPGAYLLAVIVLATAFGINWLGNAVLPRILPIPILPDMFSEFIGVYLATVEMRILGLLYRAKKDDLGWFAK